MPYKRKKKRKLLGWVIIAIVLLVVYCGYQYMRYNEIISTPVDKTDLTNISFVIKKGDTTTDIAHNLAEKDLILDEDTFKLFTKLNGTDRKIVAGRFLLSRSQTIPQITDVIVNNKQSELVLTVLEGETVIDIDKKLADLESIEPGDFEKAVQQFDQYEKYPFLEKDQIKDLIYPLEGYLFPDTYYISPTDFYSENLIQLMLQNFKSKLDANIEQIPSKHSLQDYIIMASILEKEVRTKKDMPIVSGILWKRLDSGWMIGADATLLYNKADREIDYFDLQEDSPYNTRNHAGLPPGPIANPGIELIEASMFPEESPYYFYLTTLDTGEVIYAASNEEHNENKRKYL